MSESAGWDRKGSLRVSSCFKNACKGILLILPATLVCDGNLVLLRALLSLKLVVMNLQIECTNSASQSKTLFVLNHFIKEVYFCECMLIPSWKRAWDPVVLLTWTSMHNSKSILTPRNTRDVVLSWLSTRAMCNLT